MHGEIKYQPSVASLADSLPARRGKLLHVLYAEDDELLATFFKLALERAGHLVECVEDGQKAFDRIVADPQYFDVLVTDHQMPRLSGLELVEKLRGVAFPGAIVVHSSNLLASDANAYRALNVDHLLDKPLKLAVLLAAIQERAGRLL